MFNFEIFNYFGFPLVKDLVSYAEECGFMNKSGGLHDEIFDKFIFEGDKIYIDKFWCEYLCSDKGTPKRPFVSFQIALCYLKLAEQCGIVKVTFKQHGKVYEPVWGDLHYDIKKSTKDNIKLLKREYLTKTAGCPHKTKKFDAGFIKLCCVCMNKKMMIMKEA